MYAKIEFLLAALTSLFLTGSFFAVSFLACLAYLLSSIASLTLSLMLLIQFLVISSALWSISTSLSLIYSVDFEYRISLIGKQILWNSIPLLLGVLTSSILLLRSFSSRIP